MFNYSIDNEFHVLAIQILVFSIGESFGRRRCRACTRLSRMAVLVPPELNLDRRRDWRAMD